MCGILLWYIYKSQKNHKEEVMQLTEAIQNNTVVMEKILTKIGG
nr:MAG TPA: resistance to inhibitors of cholinesterase-like protein [Caudoviricetes sp.]